MQIESSSLPRTYELTTIITMLQCWIHHASLCTAYHRHYTTMPHEDVPHANDRGLTTGNSLYYANITRHRRLMSPWTNLLTDVNRQSDFDKLHDYPTSRANVVSFKLFDQPSHPRPNLSFKLPDRRTTSATVYSLNYSTDRRLYWPLCH